MLAPQPLQWSLPGQHLAALRWFFDHAGQEVPWPQPLTDGTLVASKAKGIYKPKWSRYALSVRQALSGPYPDHEPRVAGVDDWVFHYFQEGGTPGKRDKAAANRGLLACMEDRVPVGVFRQVKPKPGSRYLVLGLARVMSWDDGYFTLHSIRRAEAAEGGLGV